MLTVSEQLFNNDENHEQAIRHMLANPHPQRPEGFIRQVEGDERHTTRDRLGELKMPVHVLGAECDVLDPGLEVEGAGPADPGREADVVEDAAHGMNLERADEFNRARPRLPRRARRSANHRPTRER